MTNDTIDLIFKQLNYAYKSWQAPVITLMSHEGASPFEILVSTLLSLRTKDEVTAEAAKRLLLKANTPKHMLNLDEEQIRSLIYPVGFYKTKAKHLKLLPDVLTELYDGVIPETVEELIELPGVGRKTANRVVAVAFKKPAICVDIHMHRMMNRFGYIKTKNPYDTEMKLREQLPKKYWITISGIIVAYGQHICRPISPKCSECIIKDQCKRIGVTTSR